MLNNPGAGNPSTNYSNSTRDTNHDLRRLVLRICLVDGWVNRWVEWTPTASLARRLRLSTNPQQRTGNARNTEHHQDASDEIHRVTSVGLTRIELGLETQCSQGKSTDM